MKCSKCGFEGDESFFRKDKGRKNGFHPWCKRCHCANTVERNRRKPKPTSKKCVRCGLEKPIHEFQRKVMKNAKYSQLRVLCHDCEINSVEVRKKQKRDAQKTYCEKNYELIKQNKARWYGKKALKFKMQRDELKSRVIKEKGGKCESCGLELSKETPSFCFDFHHRDPRIKENEVGHLLQYAVRTKENEKRIKKFIEESNKCMILCAVCHRKVHYEIGEC